MLSKYFQEFLKDNCLQAGEEFSIVDKNGGEMPNKDTFYIKANPTGPGDILKCSSSYKSYDYIYTLVSLLNGTVFIKKKPYLPKDGDRCYYVTPTKKIEKVLFFDSNNMLHRILRKKGKLYKTPTEALKHLDQDYKDLMEEK